MNIEGASCDVIVPQLPLGKNFFVWLTHDVDRIQKTFLHSLYYSVKNGKPSHLINHAKGKNPYWVFDKFIEIEAQFNVKSTFFFLNETMKPDVLKPKTFVLAKGRYDISSPLVRDIIKKIDHLG